MHLCEYAIMMNVESSVNESLVAAIVLVIESWSERETQDSLCLCRLLSQKQTHVEHHFCKIGLLRKTFIFVQHIHFLRMSIDLCL